MKLQLSVPQSWDEISLSTFDRICKIPETSKDYSREVFKATLNLEDTDVNLINASEYLYLIDKLQWMNEYPPLNKIPKDKITLAGKTYDVMLFPNRMTASQFIDYRYLLLNDKSPIKQAKLLAIFIVPEGSSYNDDSYDFDGVAQIIYDNLSIEYALGLSQLFVLVSTTYLLVSLQSSAQNLKTLLKGEKDPTIKKTLKETLKELKKIKAEIKKGLKMKQEKLKLLMKPIGHK